MLCEDQQIQRHFSVKTMNNKYYFHTKTLTSILQSDRHFDSQSTAQTQAQKQNVRGKCHYVNTELKVGKTELQREYPGYYLGRHWNKKCWTLIHTLLFYDQPLLHSNKFPPFNLPWVTLMPFAICTSLKLMRWLENQMPISSEVSVTIILDDLAEVWVFIWARHMRSDSGDKQLRSRMLQVNKPVTETIATGNQHWGFNNLNTTQAPFFSASALLHLTLRRIQQRIRTGESGHCGKLLVWLHKLLSLLLTKNLFKNRYLTSLQST